MKLFINDKHISLIFENKIEATNVKEKFTYNDMSNVFARGRFDAKKIKKVCFLKKVKKYNFLYSGFLQELALFCKKNKIKITEVKDERTKFPYQKKKFTDEDLRKILPKFNYVEHQVRSLKAMLKTNVGIIEAPTSSGKADLLITFIKIVKLPTLILVNRVSLGIQLYERIKKSGLEAGFCNGKGYKKGDIVVSTIGSVKKLPDLTKYKVLLIDESHHLQSNQFQKFLEASSYPIRFGFSATPDCEDKYKFALIRQYIGNVICKIPTKEVIDNKVIAKPIIKFVKVKCVPTLDWPSAEYKNIIWNKERNDKIVSLVKKTNIQSLILIRKLDHGRNLSEMIKGSVFVSGDIDPDVRQKIINDYEDGKIKTIIATSVFNEGISINAIEMLIIASGGKSKIESLQRLGRSLRLNPKTGKVEVLVYDFYDSENKFTERHSDERIRNYKKAGFEVQYVA